MQTLWSAIKDAPEEYLKVMRPIVDRIAYNPDMNFKEIILVPDDSFVCPRLWQRIAITSSGNYLKCPSDFCMEEILGNVAQYSVKQAWDILQGKQREQHVAGQKSQSVVCNKCHHGAKKKQIELAVDSEQRSDYSYEYKKEFSGSGMNRKD